jgi:uncharacterized protein YodC (DUF2158 family)
MSVRATDSLIGDVVTVSGIPGSPRMVVREVNTDDRLITTIWFSDSHEIQTGVFPAGALERYVETVTAAKAKKTTSTGATRGRKPSRK